MSARPPAASQGPGWGGPKSGIPARRYSRPPFPPGNTASLRSGHRSPRVYGELAELLAAGLVDDRPDLAAYPEAVAGWATCEAQAALIRRRLAEVGTFDPDTGQPRNDLLRWLRAFERSAAEHRTVLGLDPRSEASLARERATASVLAVDLQALTERGRAALAARPEAPPDLAGEVLARVAVRGDALMDEARRAAEAAAGLTAESAEQSAAQTDTTTERQP